MVGGRAYTSSIPVPNGGRGIARDVGTRGELGGGATGCTPRGRIWIMETCREQSRTLSDHHGKESTLTTNISEPLITEGEAAGILRVSLTSLRRWRRQGCGPVYRKLGRAVRYRPNDLSDFVASAGRRETGWRQRQAGATGSVGWQCA
jgi:hypothetical protein